MSEERKQSKLRELYAYRTRLTEKLTELTKTKGCIEIDITDSNMRLAGVLKQIEYIEGRKLLITTHAMERYRERINSEATDELIHAHLITSQVIEMVTKLGSGTYPVDDFHVVVEDNKIITVITPPPKQKPAHASFVKPRKRKPRRH